MEIPTRRQMLQLWQKGPYCWSKKKMPAEGNAVTATSHQFKIEEEWEAEASFAVAEETELMSSELADYQLDDAGSFTREQLLDDDPDEQR
ncbi:hypothetical protein AMTR_s00001p00263130 [Amborella trichopoda]|uniref:Uncharacterized protein n=1 Tax=Amborella trichopoda TaxID=13333 RepID=W1NLU2_AMBTC|nr:hypothetical protein AMTR_s00001p00263130 [Amborella trichopoda]